MTAWRATDDGTLMDGTTADFVTIASGASRARIALRGAELRSFVVGGRERLWQADPAFWPKSAPILFPAVGRSAGAEIRVDGRAYPMPIHGFASTSAFVVESAGVDEATLVLADSPETRRHYPFAFRLSVTFAIAESRLAVRLDVTNTGDRPMPYAAGLHPAFLWPERGTGEGAAIRFAADETPLVPVITPDGLFDTARRPVTIKDRRMILSQDNLGSEAVVFLDAASRAVTFLPGDGTAIDVENEGFAHIALWTREGAPFLSIESWTGHGDAPGYSGEFDARPSITLLPPGETRTHAARYSLREAAA